MSSVHNIINKYLSQKNDNQHFFKCTIQRSVSYQRNVFADVPYKMIWYVWINQVERKQSTMLVNLIKVRHSDISVFSDILPVKNKVLSFI